jgi:hypothetical protein
MKAYLASRYSQREVLKAYREDLRRIGVEVTSRWLDTDWPFERGSSATPPEHREKYAVIDMEDIIAADMVISFSANGKGRGGRHVEFGVGLALKKMMILVGDPEHIFHHHPSVVCVRTWEAVRCGLDRRPICVKRS